MTQRTSSLIHPHFPRDPLLPPGHSPYSPRSPAATLGCSTAYLTRCTRRGRISIPTSNSSSSLRRQRRAWSWDRQRAGMQQLDDQVHVSLPLCHRCISDDLLRICWACFFVVVAVIHWRSGSARAVVFPFFFFCFMFFVFFFVFF
jgi:hypothetical protein